MSPSTVKLKVSVAPHIRSVDNISRIMYSVIAALMLPLAGAIYFYGWCALWLTLSGIVGAVLAELIVNLIQRRFTITDGSAIITGMLVAFNVPPGAPWWLPFAGSIFAILVAKAPFGGLGYNILNPALAGRAFLMASWPNFMTKGWLAPIRPAGSTVSGVATITTATPLGVAKLQPKLASMLNTPAALKAMFIGNVGGVVGETSALLILVAALPLMFKKYIDWRIPVFYIGTVFALTGILYELGVTPLSPLAHVLAGGLFLGAFFMATDMVTSPVTRKGKIIFAIGCGIITVAIRIWGGYPEGVSYSILLMNIVTPLIDRKVRPRRFGT